MEHSFCESGAVLASDAVNLCCQEIRFGWVQVPEEIRGSIAGACEEWSSCAVVDLALVFSEVGCASVVVKPPQGQ